MLLAKIGVHWRLKYIIPEMEEFECLITRLYYAYYNFENVFLDPYFDNGVLYLAFINIKF